MGLLNSLKSYYKTLHLHVRSLNSLRWARRFVYVWVFVNYSILATQAAFFYSTKSYIPKKNFADIELLHKPFNLLHLDAFSNAYPIFLAATLIFALFAITEKAPRLSAAAVYFLLMNLDNKAYVILDGGNNLISLIAFYLIFVNTKENQSSTSTTVTNLASLMIKIQIVFVYATAGLLKVMGPLWNKGVALYYTMGVTEYGNEALFNLLTKFPILLALFTLGTVLFQISFPYLIWMRAWRPYVVFTGTCLHLSISFIMGLLMFGFAMCVSYNFFYTDDETSIIAKFLERTKKVLNKGLAI